MQLFWVHIETRDHRSVASRIILRRSDALDNGAVVFEQLSWSSFRHPVEDGSMVEIVQHHRAENDLIAVLHAELYVVAIEIESGEFSICKRHDEAINAIALCRFRPLSSGKIRIAAVPFVPGLGPRAVRLRGARTLRPRCPQRTNFSPSFILISETWPLSGSPLTDDTSSGLTSTNCPETPPSPHNSNRTSVTQQTSKSRCLRREGIQYPASTDDRPHMLRGASGATAIASAAPLSALD
jgi:hypothetical protein